ncbi:FAD-dependent oxidoreductase [Roseomonas sp. SSH11]|uniref:FAD-dependent oxidoreductase n=1 Tax=Pararoseomonas baculiformis TaxID=2820812 RepID=A0ABS4ABF0_9PROT|nr:FAD-dependent oxidoreductase [Pararoseomonas baculiformis]MBP0444330.1 FAD-dependent oxidoreductase [Pararoseomonas baculiformis]
MGDALVLGAGIMGLSTAFALTEAGHRVTVVEQDPIPNPRGSSVDDHRLIRHAYGAATGYMRMVEDAYAAWDRLFAAIGERPYAETGVLALAGGAVGEADWLGASRQALRADAHAVQDLPPDYLQERFPWLRAEGLSDAFFTPRGGVLMARRIVEATARHLNEQGALFLQGRVTSVDPARARLSLADGRVLEGDLLVIAAGPWAPRLLPGLSARVTPSRQIVVYLEPPVEQREAWARAPMLLDLSADGGFYAVPPVAGTGLKIGDHRFSCQGDADDPREATAVERDAILSLALPRLRDAESYRVLQARACYYDVEPQERFVVEPLSEHCVVMSGFSGHGFKFGPVLGEAVAASFGDPARMAALPRWAAGDARGWDIAA